MKKLTLYYFIPCLIVSPLSQAVKVERTDSNFNLEFVEGNRLDLSIASQISYTDNFFYSKEVKQSTFAYSLKPTAFMQVHNEHHLGQALVNVSSVNYANFDEDDHVNTSFLAKYFYKLAPNHRTFVSVSFDDRFEHRGTGLTQGIGHLADTGDEKQEKMVNIGYQYGRVESVSRLNISTGFEMFEYQTRRIFTRLYDFKRNFIQAEFDYLIGAKTYFTSNILYSDYKHENVMNLDRGEALLLAGINWEYSAASLLELLVGVQQIDFHENDESKNKFSWKATYTWQPNDHLELTFLTTRKTEDDVTPESDLRITDVYEMRLKYLISDYTRLTMNLIGQDSDISFNQKIREELVLSSVVGLSYKYSDWLSASLSISYNEKDSDVSLYAYDRQLTALGVDIKF